MEALVFLTGNLQDPDLQEKLKLQLTFVNHTIMFGKMYKSGKDTFCAKPNNKRQGNCVVYGSLYYVKHFEHYIRIIDTMHDCSLSLLGSNHKLDKQHRVISNITMLDFNSLDDLINLRYAEGATIEAYAYLANTHHQSIFKKISSVNKMYRVQSGVNKAFLKQWEAVNVTNI